MDVIIILAIIFGIILFAFIQGYLVEKREMIKFREMLFSLKGKVPDKQYKTERFLRIKAFYEKHSEEFQIDDITWNDLNMDEIFKRTNYCLSSTGEEVLYYLLRSPNFSEEELHHFDDITEYYSSNDEERVKYQLLMKELGTTGKYSLYDYMEYLTGLEVRSNKKELLRILFFPVTLLSFWVNLTLGILLVLAWIIWQTFDYYKKKGEIEPYTISLAYIMRLLIVSNKVKNVLPDVCEPEKKKIEESTSSLKTVGFGSFWLFSSGSSKTSGNPLDVIFDYFRMIFHFDLIVFNRMLREITKNIQQIDNLVFQMGYLESAISNALFRESLEDGYCKPAFENKGIEITEGYHPLIKEPVKNSIYAHKGVLLTGSNASGKSTFLKTMAINALLAQTTFTVTAQKYTGEFSCLFTSMSLRDDLENKESYYIVEIKAIKRILDYYKKNAVSVLCFVDEVLRGTNTVERIAASTQILKGMNGEGIQCFAATHDIELTHLLENIYDNYHFEEEIKDGDVLFNYQLKSGRATTRNAIQLLKIMGYDSEIIAEAQRQADNFLNEGIWNAT